MPDGADISKTASAILLGNSFKSDGMSYGRLFYFTFEDVRGQRTSMFLITLCKKKRVLPKLPIARLSAEGCWFCVLRSSKEFDFYPWLLNCDSNWAEPMCIEVQILQMGNSFTIQSHS